ncbi:MAG TPA: secretin N-terminal domain-containing protein [Thermoanaerobaculia bacterium]|nr:secretin N-terminal domain-containing protein [Thermoanaerobaculia bacterium]
MLALVSALAALAMLAAASGCASQSSYRKAQTAEQLGQWDDAVLDYLKALDGDPGNITYRAALLRAKIKASQAHFEKGKQFEKAEVPERALVEYQEAVQLDPTNQYAQAQLEHVRRVVNSQGRRKDLATIDQMKQKTRGARPQPPVLNPRSEQPISLEFPQPVSIFQIYRALGQAFGINVLFDPNLKDQEIAVDLKDVTAQAALETLIRAGGHFYKVIDEHTILIAADTPQNRRIYEDQVIQTFYLSNAEVKDMTTILRSLVDAKKIATNEQLNAIILRDSADKVKVAEKIIEANDKAKAEVVIDVELLQINTTRLRELGVTLSQYSITQTLDTGAAAASGGTGGTGAATTPSQVRVSDLQFLNQSNWLLTIPSFLYNFVKQSSEAQLLAKPQLRITEGGKANLVIGDRVPIPLTTFNTSNTIGGSIVPITSFTYQDVGIKIEIEPRVHHNQEVTLKVKIEVSNLNGSISGQPIIGTRTIDSTIRLKDGETNFLAGLIRTDENSNEKGIPGLSEIPVLGRLFSNKHSENNRTDVILTLTPHVIRNAEITQEDLLPIWVGTEANTTFRGGSPRVESDVEGPFEGGEATPEEIQEQIRRRIQRLPRGLRPGEADDGAGGAEQQPPRQPPPGAGQNLAPAAPPTDIFKAPPAPTPPASGQPPPPQQPPAPIPPSRQSSVGPAGSSRVALAVWRPAGSAADLPGVSPMAGAATNGGSGGRPAAGAVVAAIQGREDHPVPRDGGPDDPLPGAAVRLSLVPQRYAVAPGERIEVQVQVSCDQPISHLPLALTYDPALLAVDKVEAGDFFGPADKAQVLADFSHPGEVVVGASLLGEVPGTQGAGTVARVTFRALAKGSALVGFAATQALDRALRPVVPVSLRPVRIEIDPAAGRHRGSPGRDRQTGEPGKVPPAGSVGV